MGTVTSSFVGLSHGNRHPPILMIITTKWLKPTKLLVTVPMSQTYKAARDGSHGSNLQSCSWTIMNQPINIAMGTVTSSFVGLSHGNRHPPILMIITTNTIQYGGHDEYIYSGWYAVSCIHAECLFNIKFLVVIFCSKFFISLISNSFYHTKESIYCALNTTVDNSSF
jgi:hypothetical protein